MVFYTGDPHGDVAEIVKFCRRMRLQSSDTLVILGDVGANYYLNERDKCVKEQLNSCGPTILCIHGNHECRPAVSLVMYCTIGTVDRCMSSRSILMSFSPWMARFTRWKAGTIW